MKPLHRGAEFDADTLNAAAPAAFDARATPYPLLIVPGFTPRFGWRGGLHPRNMQRLVRALADFERKVASTILVTGAAVHSHDNEAWLMREWLIGHGVPPACILMEPHARHTTTNMLLAGRMMNLLGARKALVISSYDQAYYLGFPWLSTFHVRCLAEFGRRVGELAWLGPTHVRFRPAPAL